MTPAHEEPWKEPAWLRVLQDFLGGWRFPVLVLASLGTFTALLLALIVVPGSHEGVGAFAEEFRQWCFGLDPATGKLEWAFVLMALLSPLTLMALVAGTWFVPLRDVRRTGPRAPVARMTALGAGFVVLSCGGLVAFSGPETGALPFPAEDLRTALPVPSFRLTDQDGKPCSLDDLRGKVVLVTGVYARCSFTCPMILADVRRSLAELTPQEREQVVVVAISLDPESDSSERLLALGAAHGLSSPSARLLTGDAASVNAALDGFAITRKRDAATGLIDHANLFLLVDRGGSLAYRFTLGDRQRAWLVAGLRTLVAESAPGGTT